MGCAVTKTGGAALLKFAARFPGGRSRGAPACPSLGNPSAPGEPLERRRPPADWALPPEAARRSARGSGWRALTLTSGRRQAGGESQQQRARRRHAPHPHPVPAPGLAVPTRSGGRASHGAGAAPPLASAPLGPHLLEFAAAERRTLRGRPRVFYPRQSPPSRQCIKPFRPGRPGTSMRESSRTGPLPPGPPRTLRSLGDREGEREDSNTRAHTQTLTHSLTHSHTHSSSSHQLTVSLLTRVHTHSHTLTRVHLPHSHTSLTRARKPHSYTLIHTRAHASHSHGNTHTRARSALVSRQDLPPQGGRLGGPRGNLPATQS